MHLGLNQKTSLSLIVNQHKNSIKGLDTRCYIAGNIKIVSTLIFFRPTPARNNIQCKIVFFFCNFRVTIVLCAHHRQDCRPRPRVSPKVKIGEDPGAIACNSVTQFLFQSTVFSTAYMFINHWPNPPYLLTDTDRGIGEFLCIYLLFLTTFLFTKDQNGNWFVKKWKLCWSVLDSGPWSRELVTTTMTSSIDHGETPILTRYRISAIV